MEQTNFQNLTISAIATIIFEDMKSQLKPGQTIRQGKFGAAYPYLDAMLDLQSIKDKYAMESGQSMVLYFLSNAGAYRGDKAKLIKAELKRRLRDECGYAIK